MRITNQNIYLNDSLSFLVMTKYHFIDRNTENKKKQGKGKQLSYCEKHTF